MGPAARAAASGLAGALARAPGADGAEAILERTLAAQAQLVADCGL